MSPRIATATLLLAVLAAAVRTASASAQPPTSDALLKGTFQMSGRVTVAANVKGERVGQVVTRNWTFTPECAAGPCAAVQLVRRRAAGSDTLTLKRTPTGTYTGTGLFHAPLRCSGRIYPRGQEIPFQITVRITAANGTTANGTTASAISARYVNRVRTNLTPCIGVLGHDSAHYVGLVSPG